MTEERQELPAMSEALLGLEEVNRLLDDLAAHAQVRAVTVKGAARSRAGEDGLSLDDARAALAAGGARGVQIRYAYAGAEWSDTLMVSADGVRLIRIRHEFDR
jgi:hypothetical protein